MTGAGRWRSVPFGEPGAGNDAYDDEYVLLGLFFDGVLSTETRVNEADAALRRIVESAPSDDLLVAYKEYNAGRRGPPAA